MKASINLLDSKDLRLLGASAEACLSLLMRRAILLVIPLLAPTAIGADLAFAGRSAAGLRIVSRLPLESRDFSQLKFWGTESQEFLHPLGRLGIVFECLQEEHLRREGFLSVGAKSLGSLQQDIHAALGEALYSKHPWDNFAHTLGLSQSFVWERTREASKLLFDPHRVYASPRDWVLLAGELRNSKLCQDRLSESSNLKKVQDESSIYWVESSGAFLGWNSAALWAGLAVGSTESSPQVAQLVGKLEAELKVEGP